MHRVSFVLLGRIAVLRMSPIVTDETVWSVGLSSVICHNRELPCKNDKTDQDGVWVMNSDGPWWNHVLDVDSDPPGKGTILGGKAVAGTGILCLELCKNG